MQMDTTTSTSRMFRIRPSSKTKMDIASAIPITRFIIANAVLPVRVSAGQAEEKDAAWQEGAVADCAKKPVAKVPVIISLPR